MELHKAGNMDLEEFKSFMQDEKAMIGNNWLVKVCRVQEDNEAFEEE